MTAHNDPYVKLEAALTAAFEAVVGTDDEPVRALDWDETVFEPAWAAEIAAKAIMTLPLAERMELLGMEYSGWSGHYRAEYGGRWWNVHDKNTVHMSGCTPFYVEKQ